MKKPIVALIYDFDGTLAPGNMQEFGFIQAVGSTPQEFWSMSNQIAVGQDASNVLSYMKLMYDEAKVKGIHLRQKDFKTFGKSVEFFPGVEQWFKLVNDYKKMGGRVTTGSDSGFIYQTYGFGYINELEMLQEAGFHPLEVIQAATMNGALTPGSPVPRGQPRFCCAPCAWPGTEPGRSGARGCPAQGSCLRACRRGPCLL